MRKVYNSGQKCLGLFGMFGDCYAQLEIAKLIHRNKISAVPATPRQAAISVLVVNFSRVRNIHNERKMVMKTSIDEMSATRDTVL